MAGSSSYGTLPGTGNCDRSTEWCPDWNHEPAAIPCNSLYMYDYPWCRLSLQCYTMAGTYTGWWMVPHNLQDYSWYRKKRFPLPDRFPVDDHSGTSDGIRSEPYKIRTLHHRNRFQQRSSSSFRNQRKILPCNGLCSMWSVCRSCSYRLCSSYTYCTAGYRCRT